jgi:hypothetical protein
VTTVLANHIDGRVAEPLDGVLDDTDRRRADVPSSRL